MVINMKTVYKILITILIISALSLSAVSVSAAEISHNNRQKQFKNTSSVRFKNSAQLLDLPESYSSKDLGWCTSVKNQKGDMCWNFASISTFETALLKQKQYSAPLSTDALDKWALPDSNGEGWIRKEADWGTTLIPLGYFTSRNGAVEQNSSEPKYSVNAVSYYDKGDDALIKLAIMRTGSVVASYISDGYAYSKNLHAYCLTDPISSSLGHTISVVGWDDHYSKENFDGNYTPKNDGAWLCKNSWGANYNSIGGYIWISYEDYYLFNCDTFDPSFALEHIETISTDEHLYQNEIYGATYNFSFIDNKDITYFNVFDFSKNGNVLEKVIFETTSLGAKYNVYYAPVDENGRPINDRAKWKPLKKGTVDYNGYYCVELNNVIIPKKKGAIAVEINTDTPKCTAQNNIGVSEWLREADTQNMRFKETCKYKQSFVTYNNGIVDVRDYYIKERNDYIGGTLVIKAVTNDKVNTEIKGDVNYDETVSISDATLIQKHLAKMETLDYDKLENADYNGDGTVDIKDTTAIQKRLANIS